MEGARGEGAGCSGAEAGCAGPGRQGEAGSGRSLCGLCAARGHLRLLQGAATARMLVRMLAWRWWLGLTERPKGGLAAASGAWGSTAPGGSWLEGQEETRREEGPGRGGSRRVWWAEMADGEVRRR